MLPPSNLEVTITKIDKKYKATCNAFPKCAGYSENKEEALSNLANSISRFISKASNKAFKSIFLSNNYTDVILGATPEKPTEKRIFASNPDKHIPGLPINIRIKPITNFPGAPKKKKPAFPIKELQNILSSEDSPSGHESSAINQIVAVLGRHTEEFGFGLPLSFN